MGFFSKTKTYKLELTKNELAMLGSTLTLWRYKAQESGNLSKPFQELTNSIMDKVNTIQNGIAGSGGAVNSFETMEGHEYLDGQMLEAGKYFAGEVSHSLNELLEMLKGKM